MFRILCVIFAFITAVPSFVQAEATEPKQPGETIILTGGVSLWIWEKWKAQPHDNWWANFVRASRIRIEQIKTANPGQQITWLVYRPGYLARSRQDSKDYTALISSVRDAFGVKLMWFDNASQVINYLNYGQPRAQTKINRFEYFGHSNKACFLFDYSNVIDSASKCWLHESELGKINRGLFTSDALVRSWGCHTGESMSGKFRSATGAPMWGLIGKSQYMTDELPVPATVTGHWVK